MRGWFGEWLKGKGEETKGRYSGVEKAFLGYLGARADRPLGGVTPADIDRYINTSREEKKWSDKTAALHLQALKSAFNGARRLQMIDSNPADPISVSVEDEVERELFTEAEAKLILDAADGEWKTLLLVGYYSGLRLTKAATFALGRSGPRGKDHFRAEAR